MTTSSSSLAWRIPWTQEPGGLQSMGLRGEDTIQQPTHTHAQAKLICLISGSDPGSQSRNSQLQDVEPWPD